MGLTKVTYSMIDSAPVNVLDYGADATGVADSTSAIQDALDAAKTSTKRCFIPAGVYKITQIAFPSGIEIFGAGIGAYGGLDGSSGTVLVQNDGVNDDAIIFQTTLSSGFERAGPYYIHDFCVRHNGTSDTLGNGISYRKAGDRTDVANYALINGSSIMERVLIRGFPENGLYNKRGCSPAYFYDIETFFNNGYGMKFDGLNNLSQLVIENCSGDGNKGGAAIYVASSPTSSSVYISNVFSEYRSDNPYGNTTGFAGAQPYAIEIGNFGSGGSNGTVYINGTIGNSVVTNEAVDACIFVNSTISTSQPKIIFSNIVNNKPGRVTGNGYTLYDSVSALSVPYTISDGVYSATGTSFSSIGDNFSVAGFDGTVVKPTVGTSGFQSKGTAPTLSWYETDAIADEKGWFFGPSSGNMYLRTMTDNGSVSDTVFEMARVGNDVTGTYWKKGNIWESSVQEMTALPTYADNASAVAAGLTSGRIYKTSTGELRIVV